MRRMIITGYALFCFALQLSAQHKEIFRVNNKDYTEFLAKERYKYPEFTRSELYLKNGDTAFVKINLNYFDQQIKYISASGDTMDLVKKDIHYITTGTDTTFNENNKLYEWVASSSKARLAVRHIFNLDNTEVQGGAFGTSSSAYKIESHKALLGGIELDPDETLVFSDEITYYIELFKDGNFVVANKKNIANLFPNSNVEDYIKDNKLNLDNIDDLLQVFSYAHKRK